MSQCLSDLDLERYHAQELPGPERALVEAHLKSCSACARRSAELLEGHEAVVRALRDLPGNEGETMPSREPEAGWEQAGSVRPVIEGYEILCELGHGGMGVVYQARDTRLDRLVAIKTIQGEYRSESRLKLLRREAQLAARLHHQNIVAVHALFESCDPPSVVMEWVDGLPIDVAARRVGTRAAVVLVLKVVRAVAYAHRMGVIHRDLKPANILVDRFDEPRLLDFGLARACVALDRSSSADVIKGTPLFMAPEQFTAPADVGPAADLYALGLVLYTVLTGAGPPQPRSSATISDWATREVPLPRQLNPDIPEALQRICLKACESRAEDRYATADYLADDLQRYLDGRPVLARPTRYARLLAERVQVHVDELAGWQQEQLISRREADALQDRYLKLLRTESMWVPGARRLRYGPVLVQAGGWLVVISTVLWLGFYWKDLNGLQRVLAVAFPTLSINAAAFVIWRRFSPLVALLFTVVGTLLIPLLLMVLLFETGLLSTRAIDGGHLRIHAYLPNDQADVTAIPAGSQPVRAVVPLGQFDGRYELLPPQWFSNQQFAAAFWLAAGYTALLLRRSRYALLSATLCLMLLLTAASTLLLAGMKDWLSHELYARTAAACSPIPVLFYVVARSLDRPGGDHLAAPFYAVAGAGFLAVIGVITYDAPRTWFGLVHSGDSSQVDSLDLARELLLLGCGMICFVVAWLHDRSAARLRRLWGSLYFRVVPPCLVISVDLLGDQPIWSLGQLGGEPVRLLELLVPVLCVLLILGGTAMQLRWFTYYGLLHLAMYLMRTTHRHFRDYLSWPVIVIAVGAIAIVVGLLLEHRRLAGQTAGRRSAADSSA